VRLITVIVLLSGCFVYTIWKHLSVALFVCLPVCLYIHLSTSVSRLDLITFGARDARVRVVGFGIGISAIRALA